MPGEIRGKKIIDLQHFKEIQPFILHVNKLGRNRKGSRLKTQIELLAKIRLRMSII